MRLISPDAHSVKLRADAAQRLHDAKEGLAEARTLHQCSPSDVSSEWMRRATDEFEDASAVASEWMVAGAFTRDYKESTT